MKCYLIRHGKDDDTVRGGWSDTPLSDEGMMQVAQLSLQFCGVGVGQIYTSDLRRARQTADILSEKLGGVPVTNLPEFREVNNGLLAGVKNDVAKKQYPGLYWSALEWDAHYPSGESPYAFFVRISTAWDKFKVRLQNIGDDAILVTHGGVVNVILCCENGIAYSNKANPYPISNAQMVCIEI